MSSFSSDGSGLESCLRDALQTRHNIPMLWFGYQPTPDDVFRIPFPAR